MRPNDLNPDSRINPKLEIGDRVCLLFMDGETLSPGTWGVAGESFDAAGEWMYKVAWDDGDYENIGKRMSTLSLSIKKDTWTKDPYYTNKKRGIKKESYLITKKQLINLVSKVL
jgi:hypothetical protein